MDDKTIVENENMLTCGITTIKDDLSEGILEDQKVFEENIIYNGELITNASVSFNNPFNTIKREENEQDIEEEAQNEITICLLCEFTSNSIEVMLNHLKNDHGMSIDASLSSTANNHSKQCHLCFYEGTDLNSHLKFHCPLCEYTADRRCTLRKHVDRIHLNKVAKNPIGDLHGVKNKATWKKDKICNFCDYTTITNSELITHIKVYHLHIKEYKCERCDFICARKCNLKDHINQVHLKIRQKKSFICKFCEFKTTQKSFLQAHMNSIHLNITTFKCDRCDYGTNWKNALRGHVNAVHLKIKKEKCHFCDFATARKQNLQDHIDGVHLKKRDRKCKLCDYTTCRRSNLNDHVKRVHWDVEKIKCHLCKYSTFLESELDLHKREAHDIRSEHEGSEN